MRAKNDGLGSALSNELSDEVNQKGRWGLPKVQKIRNLLMRKDAVGQGAEEKCATEWFWQSINLLWKFNVLKFLGFPVDGETSNLNCTVVLKEIALELHEIIFFYLAVEVMINVLVGLTRSKFYLLKVKTFAIFAAKRCHHWNAKSDVN